MKMTAPVGNGVGTQKFSIKPGAGGGLQLSDSPGTPLQAAAAAAETPAETPVIPPAPVPPAMPFSRLYPGVDPSKVEMTLDDKTGKIRFKPIETPPETPSQTPAPPIPPAPVTPAEPDAVALLKAELAQQGQLMTAMLQAQMTGRPIAEILSGQPAAPAEPDYSRFDLEDEDSRAAFVRQVRADALAAAKAEVQAQMNQHTPSIQNAQRQGERFAVQAEHGNDPDYAQKVALTDQLVGNNPNVSFKATYNLISQIQRSLTPASAPKAVTNGSPILTPAQAEAKAAQAARYPANNGGRAVGGPVMPPGIKNKDIWRWVEFQLASGKTEEELWAANGASPRR